MASTSERAPVGGRVVEALRSLGRDHSLRARALEALRRDGADDGALADWALEAVLAPYASPSGEALLSEAAARAEEAGVRLAGCSVSLLLAASVPTACVRAVALALARGASELRVRAPLRQRALPALLGECLVAQGFDGRRGPRVTLAGLDVSGPAFVQQAEDASRRAGSALLAFGSDETLRAVEQACPAAVGLEARGHGFGLAVLAAANGDAEASWEARAARLAEDVCAFEQLGCLSPRAALVVSAGEEPAEASASAERFGAALAAALARPPWPRAPLAATPSLGAAVLQWQGVWAARAARFERGRGYAVAVLADGDAEASLPETPGARCVPVVPVAGARALRALLRAEAGFVTQFALDAALTAELREVCAAAAPAARATALGAMQRPPLDGYEDPRPPRVRRAAAEVLRATRR